MLLAAAVASLAIAPIAFVTTIPWRVILSGVVLVIVFIPIRRYAFDTGLPIQLEPYRVVVALVLGGWLASLLVDSRTRLRRTGLEGPIFALGAVAVASVLANTSRAALVQTEVIKSLSFLASFLLVFFLVASVIRDRRDVDVMLRTLVVGMATVGALAVVESRTGLSPFAHMDRLFPLLRDTGELDRGSGIRAVGPAEHPIALGAVLVLVVPIAFHFAQVSARRRPLWWAALVVIAMGALATLSRTGVVMLIVVALVFLWLRTRETLRMWPLLLPFLAVVHFAAPGTLGTLKHSFLPEEGLIAQQQLDRGDCDDNGRIADLGQTFDEVAQQPMLGIGYGTRIVTGDDANACILDNQWLGTLLETGVIGLLVLLWLFALLIRRLGQAASRRGHAGDLAAALAASIAAYAVGMLTYDALGFIQVTFVLFLLMGVASTVVLHARESAERLGSTA